MGEEGRWGRESEGARKRGKEGGREGWEERHKGREKEGWGTRK